MASNEAGTVGSVATLWRYPVKSMLGEELAEARLDERGIAGDRAYALVDGETGRVASAKHPRKWGWLPQCRAAYASAPTADGAPAALRITLPDGSVVGSTDAGADARLSALVGRSVSLAATPPAEATIEKFWPADGGMAPRGDVVESVGGDAVTTVTIGAGAPPGRFFDFAPLHLVITTTLERLQAHYPAGRFDARRFRPNVVVSTSSQDDYPESGWSGRTLLLGDEVRLRIIFSVPRCVVTTLARADLPEDAGILKTVAQFNRVPVGDLGSVPCVGVYAQILSGGAVRAGDAVRLE